MCSSFFFIFLTSMSLHTHMRTSHVATQYATKKFNEISEAYEVLSNHQLRARFERGGVRGLKTGEYAHMPVDACP